MKAKLFYRNQMTGNYKQVEGELRTILNNCITTPDNIELKLFIYYKNKKIKNMFIQNNLHQPAEKFNVVYKYLCNEEPCTEAHVCYIGHTTTTIKERFKQHAAIKKHYRLTHNRNITGSQMISNVTIIDSAHSKQDLSIIEALHIKEQKPNINIQAEDFNKTLRVFK